MSDAQFYFVASVGLVLCAIGMALLLFLALH
jgi:hypothetical protein